jgi:hypothetical protein
VDEPGQHPPGHQPRLRPDHAPVQVQVAVRGAGGLRVVTGDGVVGECTQQVTVTRRGSVLERAHAQMARGYPGEHRARQRPFPEHPLARGDHRERPRGRDAQPVHGFADDILAQHRAYHGLAVSAPGKRGPPGPLEMKVAAAPLYIDHLAEQQRAAVPEAGRVHAELVAGVGLGDRREPLRGLSDQQSDARGLPQLRRIGAQLDRQLFVEHQQFGVGRRGRHPRHGKARHLAGVGILEPEQSRRDGHAFEITGQPPSGKSLLLPCGTPDPPATGEPRRPCRSGADCVRTKSPR